MVKTVFLLFILCLSFSTFAKKKSHKMGRKYFNQFLGHVHKNPTKESTSKTIVQCSHSVELLYKQGTPKGWHYVRVGEDFGYIEERFLSRKRPQCLQGKYPKFYNKMGLDITDMYYWGRLSDHYVQGRTTVN